MKQKTETPKIQIQRRTQNTKVPTYEEPLQQNKNLNQKIQDLRKRTEEILNIHKRRQEHHNPPPRNRDERMDLIETDEEEENVHPWITVSSPKKRENKQNQKTTNSNLQKTGDQETIHIVITTPATKTSNNHQ